MGFLWFLTGGWALMMMLASVAGMKQEPGFAMVAMVLGIGPIALLVWFVVARAGRRETAHAAMIEEAGVQPRAGRDHAEGPTGIAINKGAQTVTLLVDGFHKTYPFADVREWKSMKHTAGQVVGVGVHGGIAALSANVVAERQAAAATGFFVIVRDVDNPSWRIEMKSEATQARWMEIFQQEINERK